MGDFYLDENVSEALVDLLKAFGHGVVSTAQLGNKGVSDVGQLLLAARMGRILVTHNHRHFAMLHEAWLAFAAEWNPPVMPIHPGILVVPDSGIVDLTVTARAIDQAISGLGPMENRLLVWRPAAGWREELT